MNRKEDGKTIQDDPIVKLGYFSAVHGGHENGKVIGTKRVRAN